MIQQHMVGAQAARPIRLGMRADNGDDHGTQMLRPLHRQRTNPARCRVDENVIAGPHLVGPAQQELGGQAFQKQCCGGLIIEMCRQFDQPVRRHHTLLAVSAR